MVIYKPKLHYEGPDYFTYLIHDGQNVQFHSGGFSSKPKAESVNEVTIHVRNCRVFESGVLKQKAAAASAAGDGGLASAPLQSKHPLCPCAASEESVIGNMTECLTGFYDICASESSRYHFLNLCLVCEAGFIYPSNSPEAPFSEACVTEVIRSVGFITQRGFCSGKPAMECSTELLSVGGREAVNYLTLKPYTLHGSYTQLGNGYGGYGWYDSAIYN